VNIPKRRYAKANDPGLSRPRGGRPADPDPYIFHSVGLTEKQWQFVASWFPTGNASVALRSLLDRAMKFWPQGPFAFGHPRKKKGGAL